MLKLTLEKDVRTTRKKYYRPFIIVLTILLLSFPVSKLSADAWERIKPANLKKTREAIRKLSQLRKPVELKSQYGDYRTIMHAHSHFSHDSNGTVEEIRKAAIKAGVKIIMFTEHPAKHYDYFKDGNRGLKDGVLFIPGAESNGLHNYPTQSVKGIRMQTPQEQTDIVTRNNGLTFLCHLEERMDWELDNLTGSEIYNLHADFKGEKNLIKALTTPNGILQILPIIKEYPQEMIGAIQDYPADYLKKWDELCQKYPHTGVSANDSHHNQRVHAFVDDDGKLALENADKQVIANVDPEKVPLIKPILFGKKKGDTIFLLDLDPYEVSFHHVSTHLLMNEQTETAVRETLKAGRAYVCFDWLADPVGFVFQAMQNGTTFQMGQQLELKKKCLLQSESPIPVEFRVMRNGKEEFKAEGRKLSFPVSKAGIYRLEAWVKIGDEKKIWILSNPIYITQK